VGINATRLFSVIYGRTLNIGRVVSPTLALIVQREAEIAAFEPRPFYTVELECGGMALAGERLDARADTDAVAAACKGGAATVRAVERKEKTERPPALYDLTTLQREAYRPLATPPSKRMIHFHKQILYIYASCDDQKMTMDVPYQAAQLTKCYPPTGVGGSIGAFQLIESEIFPSYRWAARARISVLIYSGFSEPRLKATVSSFWSRMASKVGAARWGSGTVSR